MIYCACSGKNLAGPKINMSTFFVNCASIFEFEIDWSSKNRNQRELFPRKCGKTRTTFKNMHFLQTIDMHHLLLNAVRHVNMSTSIFKSNAAQKYLYSKFISFWSPPLLQHPCLSTGLAYLQMGILKWSLIFGINSQALTLCFGHLLKNFWERVLAKCELTSGLGQG